jgi:hypothetical protein
MRHAMMFLSLVSLIAGVQFQGRASEIASPKGFSISVPDNWKEASKERLATAAAAGKKAGGKTEIAALIMGPEKDGFSPNIDIHVIPGALVLNETTEGEIVKALTDKFAAMGAKPLDVKSGHIKVGDISALTVAVERNGVQVQGKLLRQWLVYVPGKKQAYMITCTAVKSQWADSWPIFSESIKGMKIGLDDNNAATNGGK